MEIVMVSDKDKTF